MIRQVASMIRHVASPIRQSASLIRQLDSQISRFRPSATPGLPAADPRSGRLVVQGVPPPGQHLPVGTLNGEVPPSLDVMQPHGVGVARGTGGGGTSVDLGGVHRLLAAKGVGEQGGAEACVGGPGFGRGGRQLGLGEQGEHHVELADEGGVDGPGVRDGARCEPGRGGGVGGGGEGEQVEPTSGLAAPREQDVGVLAEAGLGLDEAARVVELGGEGGFHSLRAGPQRVGQRLGRR